MRVRWASPIAVVALVFAGCASDGGADETGEGRLRVVTTVAPLTSIVANIAGEAADVIGVVPEGTNSHTFDPPPSTAEVLARADVIFVNGLRLEELVLDLAADTKRDDTPLVALGDEVLPEQQYIFDFSFPKRQGKPNPHLWTDPTLVEKYAGVIRDTLVRADLRNKFVYDKNHRAYVEKLRELDAAIRAATETVPPERRKLLTYHDAYAYFARTYGWTVVGALQVENFEEPSPKEVADLIEQVKAEGVPAIFGSEVFPSPVLEQIGKEAGVRYVDVLRDDDLPGKPGDALHSYLGLMRFDYMTMVEALGGDDSALERFFVVDVTENRATYPQ